jgi:hypothetical protein
LDFVNFPFKTSKFKNDIIYIKYKFSHKFIMVCRWLNIYYSKIRIIIYLKVISMSIWIILNSLVWTRKFCHYWATILCIHPTSTLGQNCMKPSPLMGERNLHNHAYANPLLILGQILPS